MTKTNQELIGRDELNDLDVISVANTDTDEVIHEVAAQGSALFTWDYEQSRTPLQGCGAMAGWNRRGAVSAP